MGKRANSGGYAAKSPKKRVKADPVLANVAEVVMEAEHLPESCRAMLRDMLPFSLSVPSDKRHAAQTWVVNTVEQLLGTQRSALAAAIVAEDAKLANLKSSEGGLLGAAKEAEAAHDAQKAVVDAVMLALASATEAETTSRKTLVVARTDKEASEGKLTSAQEDKHTLESAFAAHFQAPMQEGKGPHFKQLDKFLKGMDPSLHSSLPSCCAKAKEDRGSFDEVVLTELEKSITLQIQSLAAVIAVETPTSVERKAAAQAAEQDYDQKKLTLQQCDAAREAAQKKQSDCEVEVGSTTKAVDEFRPQIDDATSLVEDAKSELAAFEAGPLAGFTTYKNRVEVSPELAPGGA